MVVVAAAGGMLLAAGAAKADAVSASRRETDLGGAWRCRPVFVDDRPGVPAAEDPRWSGGRLPSCWDKTSKPFPATDDLSPWLKAHAGVWTNAVPSAAWYARDLVVPAEAAGRRVAVSLRIVNTRAVVYVDGVRAGDVKFPCGDVDLTAVVRPGATHRLALFVTALPFSKTEEDFNAYDRSAIRKATVANAGVVGSVSLVVTPRGERIAEAWTECDTAKGEILFCTRGVGTAARAVATVWRQDEGPERAVTYAGAGTRFTAKWRGLAWDLHTPQNLYFARVALYDQGGRLIDETVPFRFGFRDVRIRGRDFLLNGIPLHMRAVWNGTFRRGHDERSSKRIALEACRRAKAEGYNLFIGGNYGFSEGSVGNFDPMLEACDETGMLYSFSLPHPRGFGNFALDDPAQAAAYRALAEREVSLVRNHPSIVTYAASHNCTGYSGSMNPEKIDGVWYGDPETRDAIHPDAKRRKAARTVSAMLREIDPTRSVYHHSSGNLCDWHTCNIYLNWAPRQERSDWLEHWATEGVKPLFFVEYGVPHLASWSSYRGPNFIWNCQGFINAWAAEYAAAVFGDAAYEPSQELCRLIDGDERLWARGMPFEYNSSGVARLGKQYMGVMAWYYADNMRAHRTWGITATLPWDHEKYFAYVGRKSVLDTDYLAGLGDAKDWRRTAMGEALKRWNRDDLAYIGGAGAFTDKRHAYRAGENVDKQLIVVNDRRVAQDVAWQATLGAETKKGVVRVRPGTVAKVPVRFAAPAKPGAYAIEASFAFAGGVRQEDAFAVEVRTAAEPSAEPVWLYDPVGLTRRHFDRLKIPYRLTDLTEAKLPRGRLVVGRGALTKRLLAGKLTDAAGRGSRILVFEQDKETLESVGFRVQEYGLRQVFPRSRRLMDLGFSAADVHDWAGASTLVSPTCPNLPKYEDWKLPMTTWAGFRQTRVWRCGNRAAVATVLPEKPTIGDWLPLADGGFDLQYAPLLAWRYEHGEIVFCQMDVTARTACDPAADDLTVKLVEGLSARLPAETRPYAVGARANRFGIKARLASVIRYDRNVTPKTSTSFFLSQGGAFPADVADRVKAGGYALCAGLTADEVRKVCPVAPPMVATNHCFFARIEQLPPELDGLSNADWAWHGTMSFDAFADRAPDGNAAFRVVRYGKGRYVFMQVPPWAIDDEERPQLRTSRRRAEFVLSRLLGNLGAARDYSLGAQSTAALVRYADVPEPEDDPYRYICW